jgi:bifunctional non-homologous end joining protein LigD
MQTQSPRSEPSNVGRSILEVDMSERPAPGIPDRNRYRPISEAPGDWSYVAQLHEAYKAGKHYDVRLAPNQHSHSWATRRLPEPGQATLAKQQPTHAVSWHDFQGDIPRGQYGGGKVTTHAKSKAEVVEATPDKLVFNLHSGRNSQEMVLLRTKKDKPLDWLLLNRSTTPGKYALPHDKPSYWSTSFSPSLSDKEGHLQPKVDGAHSLVLLEGNKRPRVFSYRESKRGDVLEYTHKIPGFFAQRVPKGVPRTVLRAETYLADKSGNALPSYRTAGILNSHVDKARAAQTKDRLRVMPFDIVGSEGTPYSDRLRRIGVLSAMVHGMHAPPTATTPTEKAKLLQRIKSGKHPLTSEGVVYWTDKGPTKAKVVAETDVYIRKVLPGTGRLRNSAGAFLYSKTPQGRIVGKVGSGLSDQLRKDMWLNQDRYAKSVARVSYEKETHKGALYAPRYTGIHVDKSVGA